MKFVCFFFALFVVCDFASAAWALEREAFSIAKYDLEIHLEPEQQRLGARGKITLRNDSNQLQKVVALQISSSLNWRSIRVGGKGVQFFAQSLTWEMRNSAPDGSLGRHSISQSWALTICCTMASPNPLPPAGASGARKNLSKMRGNSSGGSPDPLSATLRISSPTSCRA